jgi:GntR family transcriptional regulator / MocR family aminotransferase
VVLIVLDRDSNLGLQEQLFNRIREQILDGRLRAGAALPSSRHLADQLDISRNSVTFAYERLVNEGYLTTRPMVGTYVAETPPERMSASVEVIPRPGEAASAWNLAPAAFQGRPHSILNNSRIPIDFWPQRTDPRAFPLKSWRRHILHSLATAGHNLTEYGDPCGLAELRTAIADHVATTRGIRARAEQVVIASGAQLALNLALRVLVRSGDSMIVENPCNQGAAYLFESLKIKVHPIDVDRQGMDTANLGAIGAQLVHVMPSHQYPIGATLSSARRTELLQWAERKNVYIIEDDYDSEFRYEGTPLPALKALSPENTIYLGTFSKSLGAGLRMGYCIFPDHLAAAARAAKALLDNGQVWLEQSALAAFIVSGGFARHLRRTRARYLSRRNTIVSALRHYFPQAEICGSDAGTHLGLKLPLRFSSAHRIQALARSRNIGAYTVQSGGGHEYKGCAYEDRWLLLGYASLTEEQIEAGVMRLAQLVQEAACPSSGRTSQFNGCP